MVEQLSAFKLLYLHVIEGVTGGPRDVEQGFDLQSLRRLFNGLYIGNNSYDLARAERACRAGELDLVAFGRLFISSPDLVQCLQTDAPLTPVDEATLYGGGPHGDTDYPMWAESESAISAT